MAARKAAAPRRSTRPASRRSRSKRPPLLLPEHRHRLAGVLSLTTAGFLAYDLVDPVGAVSEGIRSGLWDVLGVGVVPVTAALAAVGLEFWGRGDVLAMLGLSRRPERTAWGCLLAVLGAIGLLALPWPALGGAVGRYEASTFAAPSGGVVAAFLLLALAACGLTLVEQTHPLLAAAWRAVRHPRSSWTAARAGLPTLTAHSLWLRVTSRWWHRPSGEPVAETTEAADAGEEAPTPRPRKRPSNGEFPAWLSGPITQAQTGQQADGLLPLDHDDPTNASDQKVTATVLAGVQKDTGQSGSNLIVLPGTAVAEAPLRSGRRGWRLPGIELLEAPAADTGRQRDKLRTIGQTIEECLDQCKAPGKVIRIDTGPTVAKFVVRPGGEVSPSKYGSRSIATNLAFALELSQPPRLQVPIPGEAAIGIEVPTADSQIVPLRSVMQAPEFRVLSDRARVAIALGADVSGHPVVTDLAAWPHGLIAGATGSGKSVCLAGILASILMQATPDDVHMLLVDPKRVELSGFADLPHLRDDHGQPRAIITDPDEAVEAMRSLADEMDQRYIRLAKASVKNIDAYRATGHRMATDVMVVDEWADLVMRSRDVVQVAIRIGQLGRAAGVHLVLATQRPDRQVLDGLLKANLPMHIAFAVSSGVDSRIILDEMGAEKLRGSGDMLCRSGGDKSRRLQGTYVSDAELARLVAHWTAQVA